MVYDFTNLVKIPGALRFEVRAQDLMEIIDKVAKSTAENVVKQKLEQTEYLSRKDAMALLKVKTNLTMQRWEAKGFLTPHRISNRIYYRKKEIYSALESFER